MPTIEGPRGPIAFERDAWGYPSVRARDRVDAAFAHGALIATDRLIQVHLLRIAAEGRLTECVADKAVFRTLDRAARAFDLTGDAGDEVAHFDVDTRAVVDAWCAGFHEVARRRWRGVVLRALGEPIRSVTPADIVGMYRMLSFFGLTSMQLTAEVGITELLARDVDPSLVPLVLGDAAGGVIPDSVAGADMSALGYFGVPAMGGSNVVGVAAHRSATGSALLWGQPHMEIGRFPPVLYAIHFDLDDGGPLTGINVPGLPMLSYGRTARTAWSYTYGHADNIDILVERCRDGRYEADGEWNPLSRRDTEVKVKGGPPETWTFWDSPYGTVVGDARAEGRYPCLRWAGLRRSGSDLNTILPIEAASNVQEAMQVHRELKVLSLHAVFADASGSIGYTLTGTVDQRPDGWDGAGPAPGWSRDSRVPDPLPESSRPWVVDPEDGLWVSANERIDGPDGTRWVTLPEPRWRKEQLQERLSALGVISVDDLGVALYDGHDRSAEVLLAVWRPLLDDPDFQALCDWAGAADHPDRDRNLCRFHALHDELIRGLVSPRIGTDAADTFLDELFLGLLYQWHLDKVLALEEPELVDADDLRALLADAWPRSAGRAAASEGDIPPTLRFVNAYFEGRLPAFLGLDGEELTLPGGPVCPFQARRTGFQGQSFVFGPAVNFVVDFSKPGIAYNLPGGASERRTGPGYGAGVDSWLRGELRPLGRQGG